MATYRDQQQQSIAPKDKIKGQDSQKKDHSSSKYSKLPNQKNYSQSIAYSQMMQDLNPSKLGINAGNLNKNSIDPVSLANDQQQEILNYNPQLRERLQVQNNLQARNQPAGEKYFKRSAYHIAIAYQIHLNNLRENGKDLQVAMIVDPTYHAKKLKGEYDRGNKNPSPSPNG